MINRRLAALGVHAFTASGAMLGFLALIAAVEHRFTAMFVWLAIALIVDGIDGTIARAIGVRDAEPRYSGEILDLVVDFLTYVVVPTYGLVAARIFPEALALPLAGAILISSAFYFADGEMKTREGGFRGFPALWNVAAFLLFALAPGAWLSAVVTLALVGLTFVPIVVVHPIRVRRFRVVTLALVAAWSVLAALALIANLAPSDVVRWGLLATTFGIVGIGLSFGRAQST